MGPLSCWKTKHDQNTGERRVMGCTCSIQQRTIHALYKCRTHCCYFISFILMQLKKHHTEVTGCKKTSHEEDTHRVGADKMLCHKNNLILFAKSPTNLFYLDTKTEWDGIRDGCFSRFSEVYRLNN